MDRSSVDGVEWRDYDRGEIGFRRKELSTAASADRASDEELGCSLYELPPGKRSWPYHYHTGNAEAAYVLSGSGFVRRLGDGGENDDDPGDADDRSDGEDGVAAGGGADHAGEIGREPVEAGDYLAFPADESGGHQFGNDGEEPLRLLLVSTMNDPDVTVYPEQDKVGVFAGAPPGGRSGRDVDGFWRREDAVGYWEE